jgi:hypothetical protein
MGALVDAVCPPDIVDAGCPPDIVDVTAAAVGGLVHVVMFSALR